MASFLLGHEVQFAAMSGWPGERTRNRQRSPFKASYTSTCNLLGRELSHLGAKRVVIQADVDSTQIRQDGMFRADARFNGPGVILTFESKYGPLQYPCDQFTHWQANLRAIALALEALRKVDRYGVTRRAEQYRGWKALTFRGEQYFDNAEEAAKFLAGSDLAFGDPSLIMLDLDYAKSSYKQRAADAHPDQGGDPDVFKRVTAAWEMVRSWHQRGKVGNQQST